MKVNRGLRPVSGRPDNLDRATGVPPALTKDSFENGLAALAARDEDLARVIARFGPPPMWHRKPCFATLVKIILEQQVSLASAQAVFNRLAGVVIPFSAARYRRIDDRRLQAAGLTRQKRKYSRDLAEAIATGRLRLKALPTMTDAEARQALMQIKGIGPWTADIYLLMALKRPDIWPRGDLALNAALKTLKNLESHPTPSAMDAIVGGWHPWRAVAARVLWHYYLSLRGQVAPNDF